MLQSSWHTEHCCKEASMHNTLLFYLMPNSTFCTSQNSKIWFNTHVQIHSLSLLIYVSFYIGASPKYLYSQRRRSLPQAVRDTVTTCGPYCGCGDGNGPAGWPSCPPPHAACWGRTRILRLGCRSGRPGGLGPSTTPR